MHYEISFGPINITGSNDTETTHIYVMPKAPTLVQPIPPRINGSLQQAQGRLFNVLPSGKLTVSGIELSNFGGGSSTFGGVVYNEGGHVTLQHVIFTGNQAKQGSAVYNGIYENISDSTRLRDGTGASDDGEHGEDRDDDAEYGDRFGDEGGGVGEDGKDIKLGRRSTRQRALLFVDDTECMHTSAELLRNASDIYNNEDGVVTLTCSTNCKHGGTDVRASASCSPSQVPSPSPTAFDQHKPKPSSNNGPFG